jgi:dCMP deaminase
MKLKFINYFMNIAEETSKLSSAIKLKVGCIAVNNDRILSIGYNGTVSGWDNACEELIGGKLVTKPEVIHAEMNCLMKLAQSNDSSKNSVLFTTHSPCIECAKAIYQAGASKVIYKHVYRSLEGINFLRKCDIPILSYEKVLHTYV